MRRRVQLEAGACLELCFNAFIARLIRIPRSLFRNSALVGLKISKRISSAGWRRRREGQAPVHFQLAHYEVVGS